jgi:diguanylate cyclase (GGDEF)-like protein
MSTEADGDGRTNEQLLAEIAQLKQRLAKIEADGDRPVNRGQVYFNERLQEEVARSTRYNYEFSVLLVQLDNLTAYSKKFSEESTQEILDMLRTIIRDATRKTDICCQFEPGKYGIILPYTNAPGARVVSDRLRQTVERVYNFKSMSIKLPLTLSVGGATHPRDAVSYEHLVGILGDSLAAAQARGGNCSVMADNKSTLPDSGREAQIRPVPDDFLIHAMDDEVLRCSRYGQKFALLIMAFKLPGKGTDGQQPDIKPVRETLQAIIRTIVRTLDRSYLYGDNKFAILLPSTDAEGARAVALKLIEGITTAPLSLSDGSVEVSINIGIAGFPFDDVSREGLLKRAEAALSESVKKGVNNFTAASALVKSNSKKLWDVQEWVAHLKEAGPEAMYNMVASLDLTEQYERPHSQSVARYAMAIGQGMNLSNSALRQLRTIALFHDLGKMCMPPNLITKPARLTTKEWELMLKHPQFGADILQQFPEFGYCVRPVLSHHERWDGKGYPNGLKGEKIPAEARVIAVAEALDDMVSPRPYRQRMLMQDAMEELKRNAGVQFDPAMVQALIKTAHQMQARV